jgi:general stress protein YciG
VPKNTEEPKKINRGRFAKGDGRAAEAGRKGGSVSGGNFKNDPARAAVAGRKGGHWSPSETNRATQI